MVEFLYPTVQLAFHIRLVLFPAMLVDIKAGHRQWGISLLGKEKDPQVEMPYTYLTTWYVITTQY